MIIASDLARRMQGTRTKVTMHLELSIWDIQDMEWRHRTNKIGGNVFYANGQSFYVPTNVRAEIEQNYTVSIIKSFPDGWLFGSAYVPRDDEFEPKTSATVLHVPYRGMLLRWTDGVELLKITCLCGHSVRAAVRGEVETGTRMCKSCTKRMIP